MSGSVPLRRRNLLADRRRLAASVAGVGLAVMLILLLDGVQTGIRVRSTLLEDGRFAELSAMAIDPVWAMAEEGDNPHLLIGGRTWLFCSAHCREEFAAHPDRFPLVPERAVS